MAVPEESTCILFSDGQAEAERQIKLLCTRLLPKWSELQASDMQISRISGGISNLLVRVDPKPSLLPVAVKVFGDKTELLINRDAEKLLLLQLNAAGFGAPVLALFGNGRVEQFLNAKTLTPEEMSDPCYIPHLARRIRAFHDLKLASPEPNASATAASADDGSAAFPPAPAPLGACPGSSSGLLLSQWGFISAWLDMAQTLSFPHDADKQAAYDKVDFVAMRSELTTLQEKCDRVGSPRVLCHNDLLPGNILVVQPQPQSEQQSQRKAQSVDCESSVSGDAQDGVQGSGVEMEDVLAGGELQLMDFEYSCYGPRGLDWGNHFNEYAGFDCVYDRFPTPEQQKTFFRHYLKPGELGQLAADHLKSCQTHSDHQGNHHPSSDGVEVPAASQYTTRNRSPLEAAQSQDQDVSGGVSEGLSPEAAMVCAEAAVLDRLVAEACVYALVSHAMWGVWAFIQARYSPIDFDYLEYSRMRWAEYNRRKDEFFLMVDRLFPAA